MVIDYNSQLVGKHVFFIYLIIFIYLLKTSTVDQKLTLVHHHFRLHYALTHKSIFSSITVLLSTLNNSGALCGIVQRSDAKSCNKIKYMHVNVQRLVELLNTAITTGVL